MANSTNSHRVVKEGRASCRLCRRLLVVGTKLRVGGVYQHYRVVHRPEFDLFYNQAFERLPAKIKIGHNGENRCAISKGFKRCYNTIDEAWTEVFFSAVERNVILFPYQCVGHLKSTRRLRGCHKWHVSRSCKILNP